MTDYCSVSYTQACNTQACPNITGQVYLDNAGSAVYNAVTNSCQATGLPLQTPPTGTTIQATNNGVTTAGTFTGSSFTIPNLTQAIPYTVPLTLPVLGGYRCVCPSGCTYSQTPTATNVNYYISSNPLGWWQTANGYVYALASSGTAIQSQIPASCAASPSTCTAALSTYDAGLNLTSDSTSLTGGGSTITSQVSSTPYIYLNQSATNTHAEGVTLNGAHEDYTYFSQLYGMTSNHVVDFTGAQPISPPTDGNAYYANSDVTISTPWTLNTADSMVIFVNGNLTITQPILVAKGAFLAFIVSGNITFDKSLGSNTSNTPSVAGVFVANGQIISQSNAPGTDLKLIGEGSFIGWGGVSLQRNFNNANAIRGFTEPIETFHFRPDFLVTVPTMMTKPLMIWQEVN